MAIGLRDYNPVLVFMRNTCRGRHSFSDADAPKSNSATEIKKKIKLIDKKNAVTEKIYCWSFY